MPSGFFALECPIVDPQLYRELDSVGRSFTTVYSFSTEESLRPYLSAPIRLSGSSSPTPTTASTRSTGGGTTAGS